jgi:YXWGXW repeat-containing protein
MKAHRSAKEITMFAKAAASASLAILALGTFSALPAAAQVYVQVAPPPPRHEVVPAPRPGRVWVPGHWEWRGHRHVWIGGMWMTERHGYAYRQPEWKEHDGRWEYRRGGWDRDGDGVPNRFDHQPNNPHRH